MNTAVETTAASTPIARWRERMGLSLRQAEEALGLSRQSLIRYERGDAEPPLYIGLACSALAAGLSPYRSTGPKNKIAKSKEPA